jgi:uncharacterized coiled-coil DUF342 family protein
MAQRKSGVSDEATKLAAKIYKLKDRALKIVAQAEKLANDSTADKKSVAQARSIAAEARKLADDARPARKVES